MELEILQEVALRQHGLVTRTQALQAGYTPWGWRRLLADGVLVGPAHGVARLVGAPVTPEQRILRAVLSVDTNAAASHATAAFLWRGLDHLPKGPVDIVVRRADCAHRARDDCRVHRPVDWMDVGTAQVRGIPVTQPVRTLIDIGATAPHLVESAVERLIINGVVTRSGLERAVRTHGRRGRAGIGPLRSVLAEWTFGDVPPASVLETRFSRLLVRHRLPSAEFHHPVNGYEIDAAWPDRLVGAEVDGWDKYTVKRQFQKQIERDAILSSLGWTLVHFTWNDVTRRSGYVASILRKLLLRPFSVKSR